MAGIQFFAEQLQLRTPHTFNALQHLVMAMAAVTNNAGKKTLFGRDKGQESYAKFLKCLQATVQSMTLDKAIEESTTSADALDKLQELLGNFRMAFPNWPDAYAFAGTFFCESRASAIATLERLRSSP